MTFRDKFILKPTSLESGDVLQYDANTDRFVAAKSSPLGVIAFWSLLNGAIPTGWAICNGVDNTPGPDLRSASIPGLIFIQRMT